MTYTDQDNDASVSLRSGEAFAVRLTENPTTGYRWDLADCDQSILEVARDEFHPPDAARYGAGGEHLWEFVARAPGHCVLRLVYRRRWESAGPARTFSLDVSVT
jgi:inhibitor of cysteine peptidase